MRSSTQSRNQYQSNKTLSIVNPPHYIRPYTSNLFNNLQLIKMPSTTKATYQTLDYLKRPIKDEKTLQKHKLLFAIVQVILVRNTFLQECVWRVQLIFIKFIFNKVMLSFGMAQNNIISQAAAVQNYGYLIPHQLLDLNWKKCLQNDHIDRKTVLEGVVRIRQYLSQSTQVSNLITNVLQTQIHKPLIKFGRKVLEKILTGTATPQDITCLHQIIWIFTNLCSGSKGTTSVIVQLGIVNFCKQLFFLQNLSNIISILFELIGNLAGQLNMNIKMAFLSDSNFYVFMRDKYLKYLFLPNFHENSTWAFSNLFRDFDSCHDKNNVDMYQDLILGYFPIIDQLLKIDNQEARLNLLYIFFYISKNQSFHMSQSLKIVDKFLCDPKQKIRQLVVQIIGNYIAQCDQAVDYALKHPQFLNIVFFLLKTSQKTKFRKQAAWIISNIFAGTVNQVQQFVCKPALFNQLHHILINEQSQGVIKQIIWSIANSYTTCSEKAFESIFYSSIIQPLSVKLRTCQQKTSFTVYSQGINHYLKKFEQNPNLNFNVFLSNIMQIHPSLDQALIQHSSEVVIVTNVIRAQQKIASLIKRGPITEQQMMKKHLENFSI